MGGVCDRRSGWHSSQIFPTFAGGINRVSWASNPNITAMDANGYQVWGRIANALVYAIVIPHTVIWAELYMRGDKVVEYYGDLWFFIILVWIVFLTLKALRYRFEWLNCIPCSPLSPNYPLYLPRAVTLENSMLLLFSLFPVFAYYEVLLGVGYFTEHMAEAVVFMVLVLAAGYYIPTFVCATRLRRMEKRSDRAGSVAILERMDRQRARHFIYRYDWPDYLLETLIFTALAAMLYLMQLGDAPRGARMGAAWLFLLATAAVRVAEAYPRLWLWGGWGTLGVVDAQRAITIARRYKVARLVIALAGVAVVGWMG